MRYRVLLLTNIKRDEIPHLTSLQGDFEVTALQHLETSLQTLRTWHPEIVIYAESDFNHERLKTLAQAASQISAAFYVLTPRYNLREELYSFEQGAEHYLLFNSPFETIKARLGVSAKKAVALRKIVVTPQQLPHQQPQESRLLYQDLEVFPAQKTLRVAGEIRRITPTQFRLLVAFLSNIERPLSREWLKQLVFAGKKISHRSVDAQIAKLKSSLPELRTAIVNLYGQGYMLKRPYSTAA